MRIHAMPIRNFRSVALIMIALVAAFSSSAMAQGYPNKTVRLISPYPPGGGTDATARTIATALSEQLGQQVVVDSRGGANGAIGTELAAKAAPDGYTLLLGNTATHAILPNMSQKLGYDAVRDFAPISIAALSDFVLVVHPSLPVKSVKELMALASARPGQMNYCAGGTGTPSHLAMELFKLLAKVNLQQVGYKGNGPAAIGLMSGECAAMIGSGPAVVPHFATGKVRPLGTTGLKRSIGNLPAIADVLPGYEVVQWYGILAPANTPKDIVDRLQKEIARAVASPKVTQVLTNLGLQPSTNTPEEFRVLIRMEGEKWGKVIKSANIKGD
jgi:tripartite-type tricarboxylate transporter receptor subunit TctC